MTQDKEGIKNLTNNDAVNKFKELIKHNATCLFTTHLMVTPLTTRPMSVNHVCDQGNFWFLSADDSDKNYEITDDSRVQLFFSNPSDAEFLSVYGKASISKDRNKIDEMWNPIAKAWFTEGKDDPRITVIKVTPEDAYYWDTKNGKMISLIKILASAIVGKTLSEGIEGEAVVNA